MSFRECPYGYSPKIGLLRNFCFLGRTASPSELPPMLRLHFAIRNGHTSRQNFRLSSKHLCTISNQPGKLFSTGSRRFHKNRVVLNIF